jgi:hypothetical protein
MYKLSHKGQVTVVRNGRKYNTVWDKYAIFYFVLKLFLREVLSSSAQCEEKINGIKY